MSRRLSLIVLALAACGHRDPAPCSDLGGVWHVPDGLTLFVLDHGMTLEAYAMTPDALGPRDAVTAPRVVDLTRDEAGKIAGETRRRFMRRADTCEARVAVHVTQCHTNALEVVTSDIVPPLGFAPCRWPAPEPSRVERWQRE